LRGMIVHDGARWTLDLKSKITNLRPLSVPVVPYVKAKTRDDRLKIASGDVDVTALGRKMKDDFALAAEKELKKSYGTFTYPPNKAKKLNF